MKKNKVTFHELICIIIGVYFMLAVGHALFNQYIEATYWIGMACFGYLIKIDMDKKRK